MFPSHSSYASATHTYPPPALTTVARSAILINDSCLRLLRPVVRGRAVVFTTREVMIDAGETVTVAVAPLLPQNRFNFVRLQIRAFTAMNDHATAKHGILCVTARCYGRCTTTRALCVGVKRSDIQKVIFDILSVWSSVSELTSVNKEPQ